MCAYPTILACFALLVCSCAAGRAEFEPPASSQPSIMTIPAHFLGDWRLVAAPGTILPPPYADYLVVLTPALDACTLYKDKGISRLELAQGATLRKQAGHVIVRFDGPKDLWLELTLGPEADTPPTAELIANHTGPTVEAPIQFVARQ
jgi:hypothetical protein